MTIYIVTEGATIQDINLTLNNVTKGDYENENK